MDTLDPTSKNRLSDDTCVMFAIQFIDSGCIGLM